jgi:hypothetical protein
MRSTLILLVTLSFLFGCSSSFVMRTKDNNLNNNTRICFIRPQMQLAAWVAIPIFLENKIIMKLRTKCFAYWPVKPGNYNFEIKSEDKTTIITPTQISIEIKNDETKYIILVDNITKTDEQYKTTLDPVVIPKEIADSIIAKCKLIQ